MSVLYRLTCARIYLKYRTYSPLLGVFNVQVQYWKNTSLLSRSSQCSSTHKLHTCNYDSFPKRESGLFDTTKSILHKPLCSDVEEFTSNPITSQHCNNKITAVSQDSTVNCDTNYRNTNNGIIASNNIKCSGCGSILQSSSPEEIGYIPPNRESIPSDINDKQACPICQRCFHLKHYNTALSVTLDSKDYRRHLSCLKEKRALILYMVDVVDFPSSVFPNLNELIGSKSVVYIVANKVDLLPNLNQKTLKKLEEYIHFEVSKDSLLGCDINRIVFTSAKTGRGVEELSQNIVYKWGNRGDVFLLGCTNVGKSSLFNRLLISLCGAQPGDLQTVSQVSAPSPMISYWPGTTLGLLSFPILSTGKRKRLLAQVHQHSSDFESEGLQIRNLFHSKDKKPHKYGSLPDIEEILEDIGHKKKIKEKEGVDTISSGDNKPPQNRFWLHDTPGAVNHGQLINHLTTGELKLVLPKRPLSPRTFILKPGQTLLIGGLARLDYHEGPVSVYFTVFSSSSIPIHATQTVKADDVYQRNIGQPLLKVPCGDVNRIAKFPSLQPQNFKVKGIGWKQSCADIIFSGVGWVSVTIGNEQMVDIRAYSSSSIGMWIRRPALFLDAINERGRRSQKGNRTAFLGKKSLKKK